MVRDSKVRLAKFDKLNNTTMNEFKIPPKYLIDFDTLKVGDRVWTIQCGYERITSIKDKSVLLPITTDGGTSYKADGCRYGDFSYPSLFRSNPFEDLREEFFQDTLMEVRDEDDNDEDWVKRVVFGKMNGRWIAWQNEETLEEAKTQTKIKGWDEARLITPPSEELVHLTLKDISEGKGVGVPAHLIRIKE